MARRGRKRRAGRREANGRPQRQSRVLTARVLTAIEKEADTLSVVREQPHRKKYGERFRDQMVETELGRLCMDGVIALKQYDAGERYREIVIHMRRAIAAPKPTARSSAGILVETGGKIIDFDAIDPEGAEKRANRARSEYADAYRALSEAGREAILAINDIVIEGHSLYEARGGVFDLMIGLNHLVRHFGLEGRRTA